MAKEYHGSCLCRSVQFTITGEPFSFYVCHCKNCRKFTGSALSANTFFKPEQVVITKGSEDVKVYRDTDTASGNVLLRSFCPSCGASLFLGNDKKEFTIVSFGTIEEDVDWVPRGERYPECWALSPVSPGARDYGH
ncbi:putative glutathione-dependent formaldehyde-activating enzyme [Lyophyllum shimeji]|uniref:Glutathione-dependent formaldehyde-activating enzyme n=1 Tax=Lyophyllum shimeji TaxID=47721 RepID=A0A9P3PJS7_LYOSH|nr:putative glutathione-dependent formaldehyde-activating enzyme [Lyophyllum shimeji]